MMICLSCHSAAAWPDGFRNGTKHGVEYVCLRCAEEAWELMPLTGTEFSLACPRQEDVKIEDVAYHLAGMRRYHGGCDVSVAEHAVLCSQLAPVGFELEALHHDDHEAYLSDLPGPVKRLLGQQYRLMEAKVDRVCRQAFGLPLTCSPEVKEVDLRMLRTERVRLFGRHPRPWGCDGLEPYAIEFPEWPRERAETEFKARDLFLRKRT
jgi:uncharacterized protein